MDTPVAMTNLASENVSRLNAVRRSSLVSIEKNRAYSENVTTPMVCAIACVCACSAQLMTPSCSARAAASAELRPDCSSTFSARSTPWALSVCHPGPASSGARPGAGAPV